MDEFEKWTPGADTDEVLRRLAVILAERVAGLEPDVRAQIEAAAPEAVTRVEPMPGGWLRVYIEFDGVTGERVDLGELWSVVFSETPPVPN